MKLTQEQIAAIHALEDAEGRVAPEQIVATAKDKASPLHELFDWNKNKAAEQWWLNQARLIMGAVKLQVTTATHSYHVPAYVVDTEAKGSGYRSTVALKSDPASARESLIYTLNVAAGHLRRAVDLAAPLGLSVEIDGLIAQIVGVQRVITEKAA